MYVFIFNFARLHIKSDRLLTVLDSMLISLDNNNKLKVSTIK